MTVSEMANELNLETLVRGDQDRLVAGGYAGDLLSWVMARAHEDDAWFTVMGNLNAVAVAVLVNVSCIVLTENATLDDDAAKRAAVEGVFILRSHESTFSLCAKLGNLLQ
ncbi:MAG: hypothetical protein PHX02_01560 [Oscillospiraceae bacterium]|nr:hypothetical protein [Oscillospiraceae bacterium]